MTGEEFHESDNWTNEEHFSRMKETGQWMPVGNLGVTGNPCDRCGHDVLESWDVEAWLLVEHYSISTRFEICLLCLLELNGATYGGITCKEDDDGTDI